MVRVGLGLVRARLGKMIRAQVRDDRTGQIPVPVKRAFLHPVILIFRTKHLGPACKTNISYQIITDHFSTNDVLAARTSLGDIANHVIQKLCYL